MDAASRDELLCVWINSMLKTSIERTQIWQELTDGVLLCKLANAIVPETVTVYTDFSKVGSLEEEEYRVKVIDNINHFIYFCDMLDVPKFSPKELMTQSNLPKVAETLRALKLRIDRCSIMPPSAGSARTLKFDSQESDNPSTQSSSSTTVTPSSQTRSGFDTDDDDDDGELVDFPEPDLYTPRSEPQPSTGSIFDMIYKLGSSFSSGTQSVQEISKPEGNYRGRSPSIGRILSVTSLEMGQIEQQGLSDKMLGSGEEKKVGLTKKDFREKVLKEIMLTEETYVKDLHLMSQYLLPMMEARSNLIKKEDLYLIFGNIESLYEVNKTILRFFEEELSKASSLFEMTLGRCFVEKTNFLKIYEAYCANYSEAYRTLQRVFDTSPHFAAFHQTVFSQSIWRGLRLTDFLIKPIQRLCKYPLLFRELVKYTEESHPDYKYCLEALNLTSALADSSNENNRIAENRKKLQEVQSFVQAIPPSIDLTAGEHRIYLRDGMLKKISAGKSQRRHCFLFNDLFLYCRPGLWDPTVLTYRDSLHLEAISVRPPSPHFKYAYSFEIVRLDNLKVYRLAFRDEKTMNGWYMDMKKYCKERRMTTLEAHPGTAISESALRPLDINIAGKLENLELKHNQDESVDGA